MKFLCRNCKAKYQIADEKVAGRTLRMTCQQCGEPIVVRGPAGRAPSRPLSQPIAATPLSADFQRQVVGPADTGAHKGVDEWHVAINDVPVGPMRREEVGKKIGIGAVDRESLAWREGMDDWMPIKQIPELLSLLDPRAAAPAPAPHVPPPPPAAALAPPPQVQPAARVEMAPIGSRQVLSLDDYAPMPEIAAEPAAVTAVASVPAPAAAAKPPGWAQMFLLVAGGAFILAAGALLGVRVLVPPAPPPPPAPAPAVAAPAPAAPSGVARDDEGNVIELDLQAIDGESSGGARRSGAPAAADKSKAPGGKQLTEEQKAMLARMGGGLDHAPSNIQTGGDTPRERSGGGGSLTAEQLSKVVLRGRKNLQRCYETALRGAGSDETVRIDVDLEVSPSGNVTSVKTTGKGLPGMDECITRTVRMWRFPSSGDGAQTRFPVVFQPGA